MSVSTHPSTSVSPQKTSKTSAGAVAGGAPQKAEYSMSPGLVAFLKSNQISFAATSYQSGRLYLVGWNPKGGLMVNEEFFKKAMWLHVHGDSLYMATLNHIVRLENILDDGQWLNKQYTSCFVPRSSHLTGPVDAHDVGVTSSGELRFINTRYNCIAGLSERHAFKPVWMPPFISQCVPEDRCHLNGMAMENGEVGYVTAVSKSNTIDGWRDRRADGGIVMDVRTNEVLCEGLSMPHSPRVHNGKLWVANSGSGEIGWIDRDKKTFVPLAFCPGFIRGLAFHGKYVFVGLSKPRYERFEGLALDRKLKDADSEPWAGVQIIDTTTGTVAHWFRIDGAVSEMYDVAVLPGVMCAKSVSLYSQDTGGLVTFDPADLPKS